MAKVFWRDVGFKCGSSGLLAGNLTKHFAYFLLQFTHTALSRVVVNDFDECALGEGDFLGFETVFFQLFGHEVLAGYLDFLFQDVTGDLDDFHAVEQRLRDGRQIVGSSDEQHFRQVIVNVYVVVVETAVLFGVEHLEQSR